MITEDMTPRMVLPDHRRYGKWLNDLSDGFYNCLPDFHLLLSLGVEDEQISDFLAGFDIIGPVFSALGLNKPKVVPRIGNAPCDPTPDALPDQHRRLVLLLSLPETERQKPTAERGERPWELLADSLTVAFSSVASSISS
jgi:hypothetical protein